MSDNDRTETTATRKEVQKCCEEVLDFWAEWASKQECASMGHKNRAAWLDEYIGKGKGTRRAGVLTASDLLAFEIEKAVRELPDIEQSAVIQHYLRPWAPISKIVIHARVSDKTLRARLHRAYIYLYPKLLTLARGG